MTPIGLKYGGEIDSIGDIVTGDLQTCCKCQEGTHAQVQNRLFYRIYVSQTRWLDNDGRPRWPHGVMLACQSETGLKCRLQGEYYIMVNSLRAGQQQSASLHRLRPFYYGQWRRGTAAWDGMDGCMGFWWDDPDRSTQGEVEYISVHQCQRSRAYSAAPHTLCCTHRKALLQLQGNLRSQGSLPATKTQTHHFHNILRI